MRSQDAFQKELVATIPFLRAFAHSLCRQRHVADNFALEVVTMACKARASYLQGSNLKAWLFTIARNEYYSEKRSSWRQIDWDDIGRERLPALPDKQSWSSELSDVVKGLRRLPDIQREALVLVAAGGFSYLEASQICGAPVGTIKSRVGRGRAALIQLMDREDAAARNTSSSAPH